MVIDALALADRIVATAQRFDGACACTKHRQSIFEAVGFPFDIRPFRVVDGKCIGISTCYVFALNVLRLCGIATHTWHLGEAIGAMIAWAIRNCCWQFPGDGLLPGHGDILVIGKNGGTHVCVVDYCDGTTIWTFDGGQCCYIDADDHDGIGRQMVAARSREWHGDHVVGIQLDQVVGWAVCGLAPLRQDVSQD